MGIYESATTIKANALILPDKPPNRPMRAIILAEAEKIIAEVAPEPQPPLPVPTTITISPDKPEVEAGQSQQFDAFITWSDGGNHDAETLWSTTGGAITTSGLWTAPQTPGVYSVSVRVKDHPTVTNTTTANVPESEEPPEPEQVLFHDTYATGQKAPAQNGISYTGASAGVQDGVRVESGALVFTFGGNADINDDAWAEQNMKLAPRQRLFVGMGVETDDAYFHRYPSASSNNKVLNVFGGAEGATRDEAYQQKQVGFGLHHWGYPTSHVNHGKSNLQVSMAAQGLSAGPYGTGPYTLTLNPGVNRRRLAIFMQVGTFIAPGKPAGCTAPNHGDAIMQVWLDGQMIYDHRDLPIFTPGGYNHIQYLYLLGWSNSGFTQTTAMRIRELVIASEPLTDWTT